LRMEAPARSIAAVSPIMGVLEVMHTVNHWCCRKVESVASGLLICLALLAIALPFQARAQFKGSASATGQFESNSNVFDLPSGVSPAGTSDFRRSDTYFAYGAAFDGSYLFGKQELYASGSTKEYDYQRFTELDHNDYRIDIGLNWKLSDFLDGKLDALRSHYMAPFFDLSGSELSLSLVTEQRETARVGIKLSSDWRLEGTAFTSKIDQPIPGAPNLQLTQTSGMTSIEYLGIGALTSGFTATYLTGEYSGTNGIVDPSYSQVTAALIADYYSGRTTFEGQVGYSRRNSATGIDNTSGLTGLLDLKYQATRKTVFLAKIDRTINSYFLNAGSEIDTDASASVNWQATYKLSVAGGYTFSYRNYPGQGNNPVGSDRVDIQETINLSLLYQPQRWLQIGPYANVQTRRSTFIGGHYSSNIYGVMVTVTPYQPKARH
jgi:hypothetical protein